MLPNLLYRRMNIGSIKLLLTASFVAMLASCAQQNGKENNAAPGVEKLSDLHIVDCLLPGQYRRLGQSSYLTPRRPIQTSAADCRIRGGEYVEYDRADYKTALRVWLPAAEAGDAEAQVNVGEIFERGLGGEPNYAMSVVWYKKAAEQGNSRAQFNLGTLYEQGHGVEKDSLEAMNWYRLAWGLQEDNIIFQSAARKTQEELRTKLQAQMASKEKQIAVLNRQIVQLESNVKTQQQSRDYEQEKEQLVALVAELEKQRQSAFNEFDRIPRLRQPAAAPALEATTVKAAKSVAIDDLNFGSFHALIIGNQNYDQMGSLQTPHADAIRAKEILEQQYGFKVTVLLDADSASVMRKINDFSGTLDENDNLLIFYAGHGSRIQNAGYETGYWLPVDANPPPEDTFWVSNEFVTRHLARVKAKRVMVISDSCYSGLLSNAPGYLFMGDQASYSMDYVRYKFPKRSRLLISSGGDKPVLDNADQGNSVFAKAFLDVLERSEGILTGPELFLKIRDIVTTRAERLNFKQVPQLKVIKGAGHEVGDFFFVKQS